MDNTPILTQSEKERAPWNEETKSISVTVCQLLSSDIDIQVPKDFDESNEEALEEIVREQIILPSEMINKYSPNFWSVDEFCVSY